MSELYLAAGTVLDASPVEIIDAAAAAGFDGVGLRLDPVTTTSADITAISQRLAVTGLTVFDLEVIRLNSRDRPSADRRLIEIGGELGARWLLTVSLLADDANDADDAGNTDNGDSAEHAGNTATTEALVELCQLAEPHGLRVALEFMRFTEVRTLDVAQAIVHAAGQRNLGVLVDALHLVRSGGSLDQLDHSTFAYAQLCDGPALGPDTPADLAEEARHRRLMPGTGAFDLGAFVAALPTGAAITVEVQSDQLMSAMSVPERARLAYESARAVLEPA